MKATGQIVCTRTLKAGVPERPDTLIRPADDWEVRCEWQGGRIAAISSDLVHDADPAYFRKVGEGVFQVCQYRVRVVGMMCGVNTSNDMYFVMRDGLLARLAAAVTRAVRWLSRRTFRLDKWIYKRLGRPFKPGSYLPRRTITAALLRLWNPPNWLLQC